ncbi:unnamed protein product [Mycena citricolor]|uniref:Ricin B lectin domain-containing protein n=1 Tax=Mycena citricolor TaxID=2018698 RepID=A0AAD2H769_9AGAR|nr:unnamed protein product [Mycena citricolor]
MLFSLVFTALLTSVAQGLIIERFATPAGGQCITASSNADGAALVIDNCDTVNSPASQEWSFSPFTRQNSGPQPIKVFGNKCIDVTNGVKANGTKLQIWTCAAGNTNQQWISATDSTLRLNGTNMCIDLTDGNGTPGTQLQLWTCAFRNTNQQWTALPNPRLVSNVLTTVVSSTDTVAHCMAAVSNADGAAVVIVGCLETDFAIELPNGNITWTAPSQGFTGPITTYDNKCLDVTGGSTADGTKLQIWTCTPGNTNQIFTNNGDQLVWAGKNKCVDLTDGSLVSRNPVNPNLGLCVPIEQQQPPGLVRLAPLPLRADISFLYLGQSDSRK